MTAQTRVIPAELRQAAGRHRVHAEQLAALPAAHGAVQDSLDSLGPIFAGLAAAGRDLLEQRRRCYERQAADHAELADGLDAVAELWDRHEQRAADRFGGLDSGTP